MTSKQSIYSETRRGLSAATIPTGEKWTLMLEYMHALSESEQNALIKNNKQKKKTRAM